MRISDWSSDVCSSDLGARQEAQAGVLRNAADEALGVKAPDRRPASGAGRHRHVDDMRVSGHGAHGGVDVLADELLSRVLLPDPGEAGKVLPKRNIQHAKSPHPDRRTTRTDTRRVGQK